jgi:putative transposase
MTAPLPQGAPTVERMCALAGVSRAGYYRHWAASAPRQEETAVRDAIQRLALADRHCGYRRIAEQLRREGLTVNHKRVLRLMRQDNLLCLRRRPFVPVTTDSRHGWRVVPNLARGMVPTGRDQLWVADITYIRLEEEFAFLAIVLDAFSRRVIGWALDTHLQASLAIAALTMALDMRRPAPGSLIHHSDRGVQYACGDYTALLEAHDIQPSMSRIGNPYDNAKAESFIKTLKQEEVDGRAYRDAEHARTAIGAFIEKVYNHQRLHSALDYRPPAEFEADWLAACSSSASPTNVGRINTNAGPLEHDLEPGLA